ncbi:NAD(P)-binding protein [Corynespora cassiicola Philippines]|uniref:D-xylose 1-dehydrogenase (NADP(+), D-xylono-1,5-lactone-forming) n=1 Tax=Corynespora cassiicola Philippines TaxID=1448308 RepID=A0A2T2NQH0_CORCC|nr:NAD(P)-binding protein [Corynespora cassiicola Philippines]
MSGNIAQLPSLRWGAGAISAAFVKDVTLHRKDALATHTITALGTSSLSKGEAFIAANFPSTSPPPTIHTSYDALFHDPSVDAVYIGTPHALHHTNALSAIAAGKHILVEKAFTLNARQAAAVLRAAKERGVFVMEAMWTRFHPLIDDLRRVLFEQRLIGDVRRTFCDFGQDHGIRGKARDSAQRDPALGAGSLLALGVYSLTWGLLTLEEARAEEPEVVAQQSLVDGVDVATTILLKYPSTGRQGILTSSSEFKGGWTFCRIEGTKGYILVGGPYSSAPREFSVWESNQRADRPVQRQPILERKYQVEGMGLYWEADAVALDIAHGKTENSTMPHAETLRVMRVMDEVRRQGGAKFPQDDADGHR